MRLIDADELIADLEQMAKHQDSVLQRAIFGIVETVKWRSTVAPENPLPQSDDQKAKADDGKLKLTFVPQKIISAVAYVRMYGYSKYGEQAHRWNDVSEERYQNAAYRHWLAYLEEPNGVDAESGLPHLWHLACNVAFLVTKRWKEHFKIARINHGSEKE